METCFICQQAVLGLQGQDDLLDTVILDSTDLAIRAEAFGSCHVKCLISSPWGVEWFKYRIRGQSRFPFNRHLEFSGGLHVFQNRNNDDVVILRSDGGEWFFRDKDSELLVAKNGGWLLAIKHEFNFSFDSPSSLVAEIQFALYAKRTYPLMQLVRALEVDDKLIFAHAVSKGELQFRRELADYWTPDSLSVDIAYFQFVPYEVRRALALTGRNSRP